MTAKVNLLPVASRADAARTRQRGLAVGLIVLVVAVLGIAWFFQAGVLSDAEDELADARTELAAAEAEVKELAAWADLEQLLEETDSVIRATLTNEATLAGVLQDIALVTPTDGALRSLSIDLVDGEGAGVGSFSAQAEVLQSHAPGVERFLLQLERPAGFRNAYPGGSTIDENDIATFPVTVQLGPEYRTERYRDGLPEVLR